MTDPFAALLELPGVTDAVKEARAAVDGLLGHRVLRRRSAEVTAESALRGARASAELEGAGMELERLRGQLMNGQQVTVASKDARLGQLAANAVGLHADLGSLLPSWKRSPRQALARLHVLAAVDLGLPADALGRPRTLPTDPVEDPLELGPAPQPLEVSARLDGLTRLLLAPTAAPAVVVAAVVHGELLALRAFGSVDGLVARAAARLVLVDRGLDPKAVSAPEVGHAELDAAARRAAHDHGLGVDLHSSATTHAHPHSATVLHGEEGAGSAGSAPRRYDEAARDYIEGGRDGVGRWIVHCAEAVALGAREGVAVCQALLRAPS